MIKYLGSKRTLVGAISAVVGALPGITTAADPFTGTTRVAQALKQLGLHVTANDLSAYALQFARCYIEADADEVDMAYLTTAIDTLNSLPGRPGYVTNMFCHEARYFTPDNGARIDAMRAAIDCLARGEIERSILLTSLIEAADRVDSTTGVQMAYLKQWAARAHNPIKLRVPELLPGSGRAMCADANDVSVTDICSGCDVVYLDPPYNQHSYLGNYHVWETLSRDDEPEAYGIARKRIDTRERRSDYNSTRRAEQAFTQLVRDIEAPWLVVSFNAEGFLATESIIDILADQAVHVGVLPIDHPRYVGARIGIHNKQGVKVGKISHVRTTENIFLAGDDPDVIMQALNAGAEVLGKRVPEPPYLATSMRKLRFS
ncbi:MAG: DNA adenine methylase [Thermoleophilia bacterium]|nr:DNA adenine methylase [Thermoleophilia bacterium]